MNDLPTQVQINEEGPREGFQIEPGPIATERKIELIDALSDTGLSKIQVASFVNPKRVPAGLTPTRSWRVFAARPVCATTCCGSTRKACNAPSPIRASVCAARCPPPHPRVSCAITPTAAMPRTSKVQRNQIALYQAHGLPVVRLSVMTAFGCNFEGDVSTDKVLEVTGRMLAIAEECGAKIELISLADTMGWATPVSVKRVVGAVRERWPSCRINLHLHDTRGAGIANAFAGMEMGVDSFDASVAGLGGCPFAKLKGAAGNVCTEDLVFLCEEMGIETGIDLEALIDAARLAEDIVGHPLPGSVMRGGSLKSARAKAAAA